MSCKYSNKLKNKKFGIFLYCPRKYLLNLEPTEWLYIRMSKIYQIRYQLMSEGSVISFIPSLLQGLLGLYIKYTVTTSIRLYFSSLKLT